MQESIFTKIIKGEIPSYKIYEDSKTLAFLDIYPETPGHVLVIPKIQNEKVYTLPDDFYIALWQTAKKVASHMDKIFDKRIIIKVVGEDLPEHAHIHLMPQDDNYNSSPNQATDEELAAMADKLRMI
jgi:Diadenosine tetraphosphate (Ap4A) hydrolase and other HIT family hydrolases